MAEINNYAPMFQNIRTMFYLLTPNESSFSHEDEVPQYVQQATPFFISLVLLELLVGWLRTGGLIFSLNDEVTSVSAGMVSRLPQLFVRGLELSSYVYFWDNYRIVELPWDSAWTWWLAFFGVDFCYYWVHRCAHELNILWAAHQVHHSSEYYNLSTALRQSVTQQCASWVFYLPMALAIPPSVFAVHVQFNLLYQFWIHTELVRDLGILELVLNTPSHHRVHHGRNPYCIDKNYGGVLIIWDRIFGTFAQENDPVVYGLVHPVRSFDILLVQFHYYRYLWRRFWRAQGIKYKLSVIFNGPSWKPGLPRLGNHLEVPKVTVASVGKKGALYNPEWPLPLKLYVFIHFLLVLKAFDDVLAAKMILNQWTVILMTGYILFTLTSLGYIIDQRSNSYQIETLRCAVLMILQMQGFTKPVAATLNVFIEVFISLSLLYWVMQFITQLMGGKRKQN
ncbi:alkylglycerol monooxygenase isoform X1 [Clupea harengus]|uniref:Alkylglycerol monooxygenase n=1 Tax=Clupea harengus TaxID=7950 RepID=A0A6P8G8J2_CLUHA|nr:alkylglycerol monooxygenase isoform X1 [Clupea harengus]